MRRGHGRNRSRSCTAGRARLRGRWDRALPSCASIQHPQMPTTDPCSHLATPAKSRANTLRCRWAERPPAGSPPAFSTRVATGRSGQPGRRPKAGMRRHTASRLPARRARSRCDKAMGPVCPFPLHNATGFGPVSVCAAGRFPACGRRRCERLRGFEGKPGAPRRESGPHGPEILCKSVQRFRVPVKVRGEARTRRNACWRAARAGVRRWHVRAAGLWGPIFHAGVGLPRNAYGRQ